jgi:sporulation protein YlmC with PRC-barrel domain
MEDHMKRTAIVAATIGFLAVPALAAPNATLQTSIPQSSVTVTDWYKQGVYDPNNNKIGEIMDVLVDTSGKVNTLIVGVGGFLGAGEKDVAVTFDAIEKTTLNNKTTLVMNATKDSLKNAPGFKYDRTTTSWVPDTK